MTQPRYAEFINLRKIVNAWVVYETVDGDDNETDIHDGGNI